MLKNDLLGFAGLIDSKGRVNSNYIRSTSKYYDELVEVLQPFIDEYSLENYKISEVIVMIIHDVEMNNKCEICNKETSLDTVNKTFRTFCSNKCSNNKNSSKFDKIKQTNLERYGETHNFNHTKEKRHITMMEKYGNLYPMQIPEIRKQIETTNIARYGYKNPAKSQLVIDKIRNKHQVLFDGKHFSQQHIDEVILEQLKSKDFCEKICQDKTKTFSMYASELGITTSTLLKYIRMHHELKISRKPVSSIESMLTQFIENFGITVINNSRNVIDREIDIWLPEYNLGIELNGIYWHSDILDKKNKYTALDKFKKCNEKNIKLFTFFEHEISDKFDIISDMILHSVGKYDKTVYARETNFIKITHQQKKEFFNQNHIMGDIKTSINYGLCHNGIIVAAISFIHDRFSQDKNTCEIARFAIKNGYHVPGGFAKLFKNAVKEEKFGRIVTYANLRFGNYQNVYEKNGFVYDSTTKPGYMYAKQTGRDKFEFRSRGMAVKSKLSKFLENYDETQSQYENMINHGWHRIWDCGNAKYTWTNPDTAQ